MREQPKSEEAQLLAKLDRELIKRFKKRLIDDDLDYKAWLERQIRDYLKGGKS